MVCYLATSQILLPRLFYSANLSITIDRGNKIFEDKSKLKLYFSTNSVLQKIQQEKLSHKEDTYNQEHTEKLNNYKPANKRESKQLVINFS